MLPTLTKMYLAACFEIEPEVLIKVQFRSKTKPIKPPATAPKKADIKYQKPANSVSAIKTKKSTEVAIKATTLYLKKEARPLLLITILEPVKIRFVEVDDQL